MKKLRLIKLKSERLRRIRFELRILLLMAWSRKNAKIKNRIDKITTYCRIPLEMLPREMARLYKEQLRLDDMLFHSICACRWCGDFEADLIYFLMLSQLY